MFIFKNTKSIFYGKNIPEECIEITDAQYQDLIDGKLKWNNGILVENIQDINKLLERNNKRLYKQELKDILKWFKDNDWKLNKIILGEWLDTDPRWIEYLNNRSIKRKRYDELQELIK